ncbi:MAG: hypothetical protein IPO18_09240 [bacterium]|nr:hypothetical protein [bacterium]
MPGLVLARIEPFYESLFFVGVISWLMIFLLLLIRDLDNPFGYYEEFSVPTCRWRRSKRRCCDWKPLPEVAEAR